MVSKISPATGVRTLKCLNCGNHKMYFPVKNRGRTSKRLERASCSGHQRLLTAGHPGVSCSGSASSDNSQRSINSCISQFSKLSTADQRGCLSFGFSFFLLYFFKRTSVALLSCGRWRITQTLGARARGILPSLRTLTNEAERTLDLPRRRSRHGSRPWLSTE